LKGGKITLTPLHPNQTQKPETIRVVQKKSALLVNGRRVERVITKGKPMFSVLMLEYAPKVDTTTLHPSIQPLIEGFQDVFPKIYPLASLLKGL